MEHVCSMEFQSNWKYINLLLMLTLPSIAGFCEVLYVFMDINSHITGWDLREDYFSVQYVTVFDGKQML